MRPFSAWRRAWLPLAIATGLLAVAVAGFMRSMSPAGVDRRAARGTPRSLPSIAAPFAQSSMRPVARADAVAINAAVPLSGAANIAAAAFAPVGDATDAQRSLHCMTMAVYYEAGSESADGQRAVAQVILNRLRHVAFPKTICGVVFEGASRRSGCQFSFACDGSLARPPTPDGWARARTVAAAALGGWVHAPVGLATHYHANYVVPYWAATLDKVAVVGAHLFYRWRGRWGQPAAYGGRYVGGEPDGVIAMARPAVPTEEPAAAPVASAAPLVPTIEARPVLGIDAPRAAQDDLPLQTRSRWILPRRQDGAMAPAELGDRPVLSPPAAR